MNRGNELQVNRARSFYGDGALGLFGISRKTGQKWLARHVEGEMEALEDRNWAPKFATRGTASEVERLVCTAMRLHPEPCRLTSKGAVPVIEHKLYRLGPFSPRSREKLLVWPKLNIEYRAVWLRRVRRFRGGLYHWPEPRFAVSDVLNKAVWNSVAG